MNKCCCLNLTMQRYKQYLTYTSFLAIIFQLLSFFKGCGGRMLKMLISLHISQICPIFAVSKGRGKTLKYSLRHILFYICIFIRIWGAVWWSLPLLGCGRFGLFPIDLLMSLDECLKARFAHLKRHSPLALVQEVFCAAAPIIRAISIVKNVHNNDVLLVL